MVPLPDHALCGSIARLYSLSNNVEAAALSCEKNRLHNIPGSAKDASGVDFNFCYSNGLVHATPDSIRNTSAQGAFESEAKKREVAWL
jgi:hypothetical protein